MTTVGNIKRTKIGIFCGRPSLFGNPFIIGPDGSREDVIEKFRVYFHNRLVTDRFFKDSVLDLQDNTLLCYCHPLPCHCDVIAEYLNSRNV